jgi:hypothetical protein
MCEVKNAYNISANKLKGRNNLEDLCIDRMIIVKWILNKYYLKMWTSLNWLRLGSSGKFQKRHWK